jgi:hypothetical protein
MRFLEFSRPTSATSTRAGPMPAPPMNSWRGARALACVDRRRPAGARPTWIVGRHARARGAERQATARRDPSSIRLARHRPSRAGQPGRVGARAIRSSTPRAARPASPRKLGNDSFLAAGITVISRTVARCRKILSYFYPFGSIPSISSRSISSRSH